MARRRRDVGALATALVLHALAFAWIARSPVRRIWQDRPRDAVEVTLLETRRPPPSPPLDDGPTPTPTPRPPSAPPPPSRNWKPPPPLDESQPPTRAPDVMPLSGEPSVRVPRREPGSAIGRILGTDRPLAPSLATLEGSLEARADAPVGDAERAGRNARRALERDLADDAVTAGLADDYFRQLKNRVETNWRPAMKELNDGGASVTQLGMMKSLVEDRVAWDEMWRAYLDLAKQYAQGAPPKLEPARIERLRELMRSRKGMFRFHAISELVLTQGPDGKVLTIEMPLVSGHPGIDEGAKDAIDTAVRAMVDRPPPRVSHGRSFSSTWRMRATWTMVPPTALLTGAGFDITAKGFQMDVPFDIQLKTAVTLLRTDLSRGGSVAAADDDAP